MSLEAIRSPRTLALVVMMMAGLAASLAHAQTAGQGAGQGTGQTAGQTAGQGAGPGGGTDATAALELRIKTLENQIRDLQVLTGTLESLAQTRGGAGDIGTAPNASFGGGAGGGDADGRIARLEAQMAQLSGQMDQVSGQIASLGGQPIARPRAGLGAPVGVRPGSPRFDSNNGDATNQPWAADSIPQDDRGPQDGPGQDGEVIEGQRFGGSQFREDPGQDRGQDRGQGLGQDQSFGAPRRAEPSEDARGLYEQAYAFMLRRNYTASEASFRDFLRQHPNDPLAPNAQYWLGEVSFARGDYRAAADQFLQSYTRFGNSPKGPDSLLKLGMSLERLGQREAACSSFNELPRRYPSAPQHVLQRLDQEKDNAGC